MLKLRSTRRAIAMAAATVALAGASLATATSASAQIWRQSCTGGQMDIVYHGAYQCFSWDGVPGGSSSGSYLFVNDWYDRVDAGIYKVTVSWHDVATGAWYTVQLGAWGTANQPTSNSMLYSITFHS